jgi:AAA domain
MSFLNNLKPNKPTASLEGYFISMLAKSKFGKTTFAVDLANEFYGNLDSTLILATEIGYKTMSGVFALNITEFDYADEEDEGKGFVETVDELIDTKSEHPFRFIIIDTITALERYASAYAIQKANISDKPKQRYTDITDIPWGKGYNIVAEEIYGQIDRLKKAGFGVFVIGHEKTKKIKNKDGFEYDYTTFNVMTKTSDIIEREADLIIYGDMTVEKGEKGKATTKRKLVFRSDGNILCGARFRNFPDEIDNDVDVFIETFKNAVLGLYDGDEDAVEDAKREQKEEMEAKAEKAKEKEVNENLEAESVEEVKGKIGEIISSLEKSDKMKCAKFFNKRLGMKNYAESDDLEGLEESLEFVKSLVEEE